MRRVVRAGNLSACVAIGLLACARAETAGPSNQAAWTTGQARTPVQLEENWAPWRQDAYEFVALRVTGDALDVDVRYGGGCRDHEFALVVNPAFMESYPVQMRGVLAHNANGDMCRALVKKTLEFDLTPLKRAYRAAYRVNSGVIHLRVDGWTQTVEYRF